MTDIINLPNNDENYYRKAIKALEVGQFSKGLNYFKKSLNAKFDLEVYFELVHACIVFNESKILTQIWNEYYPDENKIFEMEIMSQLYLDSLELILPPDKRLLAYYRAKKQFVERNYNQSKVTEKIEKYQALAILKLEIEEAIELAKIEAFIDENLQQGQYHFLEKIKQIYLLEVQSTLPFLKKVLVNKNIFNFIKSDIIHYLIFQNQLSLVDWIWFGMRKTLNLAEIVPYSQNNVYKEAMMEIEQYCSNENPHLEEHLKEQLTMQAMVLYPYYSEIGIQARDWVQCLLSEMGLRDDDVNFVSPSIKNFIQLSQKELLLLFYSQES